MTPLTRTTRTVPPRAAAVAEVLARRAARGLRVAPAVFRTGRRGYVRVDVEDGARPVVVVRVAARRALREWRADIAGDGTLGAWRPADGPAGLRWMLAPAAGMP